MNGSIIRLQQAKSLLAIQSTEKAACSCHRLVLPVSVKAFSFSHDGKRYIVINDRLDAKEAQQSLEKVKRQQSG